MPNYLASNKPTTEQLNQWIEFFHANGFLVIPNVLTPAQCEFLRNDLDEALKKVEGEDYQKSQKIMNRMFEHSQHNLDLFALEPIVTFAEHLIGEANGTGYSMSAEIPNANVIHFIHNNSFKIPPETDSLAKNAWHKDHTPHLLSLRLLVCNCILELRNDNILQLCCVMDRISVNPQIHFGKPCIAGTRITVQNILELLNEGLSFDAIIQDYYPDLEVEDIRACLRYAIALVAAEDIRLVSA